MLEDLHKQVDSNMIHQAIHQNGSSVWARLLCDRALPPCSTLMNKTVSILRLTTINQVVRVSFTREVSENGDAWQDDCMNPSMLKFPESQERHTSTNLMLTCRYWPFCT